MAILALWAAVAGIKLARVASGLRRLSLLKARSTPVPTALEERLHARLASCPMRRRVALRGSHEIATPAAAGLGRPHVLIPVCLSERMDAAELEQLVVHELAHLRRWDDWTNLLQRVLEALLFFNPAVKWIGRRLALEREIACDDLTVSLTGRAKSYAACLTRLVELSSGVPPLALAPEATGRPSDFFRRVELVLDRQRDRSSRVAGRAAVVATATLTLLALVLAEAPTVLGLSTAPLQGVVAAGVLGGQSSEKPDGLQHISWSDGWQGSTAVWWQGEIRLADDHRGIASIGPRASLRIRQRRDVHVRSVEVVPAEEGRPELHFYQFGLRVAGGSEQTTWLAGILPEVVRMTGLGARERARTVLADAGVDGVLAALPGLEGDASRAVYAELLLDRSDLSQGDLERLAEGVAASLESDFYRLRVVESMVRAHPGAARGTAFYSLVRGLEQEYDRARLLAAASRSGLGKTADAYLETVEGLEEDDFRYQALEALLSQRSLSGDALATALRVASPLGSDYLSMVLARLAADLPADTRVRDAFFDAYRHLGDDESRQAVLEALGPIASMDADLQLRYVSSTKAIDADERKARLLERLASDEWATEAAVLALLDVAGTLRAEDELAAVVDALLDRNHPGEEILRRAWRLVEDRLSADYQGMLLVRIGARMAAKDD
jgi:hypothetical protein